MLLGTAAYWLLPLMGTTWGYYAHRLVNRHAVDNLPAAMISDDTGNAFGDWRDWLAEHSIDPDENKNNDPLESARHWVNIDSKPVQYPYPFTTVPRSLPTYLSVFGRSNGVNPWEGWRDPLERLTEAMRQRDWAEAYREAAWLGHYVADAHTPLHAVANYDGQLSADTRNRGIHSRHESGLVYRYIDNINTSASSATTVSDPVAAAFTALVKSYEVSLVVLAADLKAQDLADDGNFNSAYYAELWRLTGADTQERLDTAARLTASMWYTAWDNAGRPRFTPHATSTTWIFY
jgi:hypothetical protein